MDTTTTIETTKHALAVTIGMDESKIKSVALQLETLRKQGLLIDLNVSGTGMFTRSANALELGISPDDHRFARYTAGTKFLISRDYVDSLRSVETRMRQLVDRYAWKVAGFAPYRWMPVSSYHVFKAKWVALLDEFHAIKATIIARLDVFSDQLSAEFAASARESWQALVGQGYTTMILKSKDGKTIRSFLNEDDYVDWVVNLAQAMMPSAAMIEDELKADYSVNIVASEVDVAAERAQIAVLNAVADQAKTEAYLAKQKAYDETKHAQAMMAIAEETENLKKAELEMKVEAMMAAELEHAKGQLAQMRSPFEEVFVQLRQQMAQDAQDMLTSIQKNGFLKGKIAEKGAGLISFFDLMATHTDSELRAKLQTLKSQIGPVGDDRTGDVPVRSTGEIAKTLADIVDLAHIEAQALQTVTKAAFIEL